MSKDVIELIDRGEVEALCALDDMNNFDEDLAEQLVVLAKIGKATKQYIKELALAQSKGENTEEFEICACVDITQFDKEKCEGCKLYEICELMAEES